MNIKDMKKKAEQIVNNKKETPSVKKTEITR